MNKHFLLFAFLIFRFSNFVSFAQINGVSFVAPPKEIGAKEINLPKTVLNANYVSIMPYGFIPKDGTTIQFNSEWQWWGEKAEGTIKTNGRVVIGKSGSISGKVECNYADIEGEFSGELFVSSLLTLKSTATISGDVVISKLSVEPGAEFNASCAMKGSVKELNNGKTNKEKTA